MIVILEDDLFLKPDTPQLLSIFQLGVEEWHLVQTDPPFYPSGDRAVNRWLSAQDRSTQEAVELVCDIGSGEDTTGISSEITLRIGAMTAADWSANPVRLPLHQASPILRRPLGLLVENKRNDGAFLCAVTPKPWRDHLLRALARGSIEIIHGGGADMRPRLNTCAREECLRLWALFDSDAREPGRPSAASEALREACLQRGVAHHQLTRRAIENYLPVKALEAWIDTGPRDRSADRRRKVAAFADMHPEFRHHFNMKGGFERDRREGIPDFFLPHAGHRDLQSGFGQEIAELFHEAKFQIAEEWLVKDGQHPELLSIVQSILRRL